MLDFTLGTCQQFLFLAVRNVIDRNLCILTCLTFISVGHKHSLSGEEDPSAHPVTASFLSPAASAAKATRNCPSEKARFHFRNSNLSALSVGKEMSLRDPHYRPSVHNPFATLPRLREGRKILGSSRDLFSSCFELPSPARVATPVPARGAGSQSGDNVLEAGGVIARGCGEFWGMDVPRASHSLPSSPTASRSRAGSYFGLEEKKLLSPLLSEESSPTTEEARPRLTTSASTSRFEDHLFQGRVQLLKRLYSGGNWITQDDSAVIIAPNTSIISSSSSGSSATATPTGSGSGYPLRRRGSCESGFFSVGTAADDIAILDSGMSSTRSIGSSLLTVSDLEEDLRAASAFLSSTNKRTSSVFTDSTDDLSSLAADFDQDHKYGYEKDIRDIVEYFEASCNMVDRRSQQSAIARSGVAAPYRANGFFLPTVRANVVDDRLPRSQKIESLIKRVVEKESRDRLLRNKTPPSTQQRLQVCDGIVRSKLPIFDHTKKQPRSRIAFDQKGIVKSKLAIFDKLNVSQTAHAQISSKKIAERRLAAILNRQEQQHSQGRSQPVLMSTGAAAGASSSSSSPTTLVPASMGAIPKISGNRPK